MRFVLVSDKYFQKPSWRIIIKTTEELIDWFKHQTLARDGMRSYIKVGMKGGHHTSAVGYALDIRAATRTQPANNPIIDFADHLTELLFTPKLEALDKGAILINVAGGYCPLIEDYHVINKEVRAAAMDWPTTVLEPRYIQWRKKGHWYAKINNEDVFVDGEQKWNTRRQAVKAAEKYMENMK